MFRCPENLAFQVEAAEFQNDPAKFIGFGYTYMIAVQFYVFICQWVSRMGVSGKML